LSNRFGAGNLKFPGDDRRLDLTDNLDKTVLIIDSNPASHRRNHDHPGAVWLAACVRR
jgi:hypothetical protein